MENITLTINKWSDYQPRKDLITLTWFRVDTGLFNGQTYFLLKNEGIILFLFLLSEAAKDNKADISLSLDYIADKIKLKNDVILSSLKKLESLQLVHTSVQNRTESSPTIQTNNTNKQTIHNKTDMSFDFESAYILYRQKKGKSAGMKKIQKEIKVQQDFDNFVKAIQNYNKDLDLNKTDQKYIKHFSTFCGEWRDWVDFEPVARSAKKTVFDVARDQMEQIDRGEL